MLEPEAIEIALAGTIFDGNLHFARVTGSTNRDAMEAGRNGAAHGSVWLAEEQTAGRGRGDHRWHSTPGEGLYVSILLRPKFPTSRLPLLPLVAGLAAAEAINATASLAVDLRWPNDLLIGPRKIGGILAESASGFAVIGIGINVHQRQFPQGLDALATSLDLETGALGDRPSSLGWKKDARVSRHDLVIALLRSIEREAAALADPAASAQIPARVAQASTWITGRRVDVHGPQACSGVTDGLDEHGFLRVKTQTGPVIVQTGGIRAAAAPSSNMV